MPANNVLAKLIGAVLLFIITFGSTLLPYKLRNVTHSTLKGMNCFCGGLFLGLCFIHLIPDVMRSFQESKDLIDLQKHYPVAELSICLGLLLVLAAEKLANVVQLKKQKKQCEASADCCKVECRRDATENSPLIDDDTVSITYSRGSEESLNHENRPESKVSIDSKNLEIVDENEKVLTQSLTTDYESSFDATVSNKFDDSGSVTDANKKVSRSQRKLRIFCMVMALTVHSILEGLAVGLQGTTIGLISILVLIGLHKCILGFSLGITITSSRAKLSSHCKNAVMFALSSPIGIIIGVCILSSKSKVLDTVVMAFLTALATGSFVFVTFFEILGKELNGSSKRDLLNLVFCISGFAVFAGLTAIPGAQA